MLSKHIGDLFNLPVSTGVFPDILSVARVVPIFKSGSEILLINYRPNSVLDAMSRILEELMCN